MTPRFVVVVVVAVAVVVVVARGVPGVVGVPVGEGPVVVVFGEVTDGGFDGAVSWNGCTMRITAAAAAASATAVHNRISRARPGRGGRGGGGGVLMSGTWQVVGSSGRGAGLPDYPPEGRVARMVALPEDSDSYFRRIDEETYQPTRHAQGAWNEDEQHMAPVAGLLAHALVGHDARPDMQLCRIGYEILGFIPAQPSRVTVRTVRPGRTIELLEATLTVGWQDVVRATGWRLARQDTSEVAGGFADPLPPPDSLTPWDGSQLWGGGFIDSLDFRVVPGGRPGRRASWIRTDVGLIEDEQVSDTAAFVALVDAANGHATRAHPQDWIFPNVDLTIHLFRQPTAGWLGLDTTVSFGETGLGLTASALFDVTGQVGRAEQILTVRRAPAPAD